MSPPLFDPFEGTAESVKVRIPWHIWPDVAAVLRAAGIEWGHAPHEWELLG